MLHVCNPWQFTDFYFFTLQKNEEYSWTHFHVHVYTPDHFQFCSYFTFVSVLLSFTLGPWGPATVQGGESLTRYKQFAIIVHQMYSVQVPSGSTQGHNTNKLRIEHSLQGPSYRTIAPKKKPAIYAPSLFLPNCTVYRTRVVSKKSHRRVIDMWVFPGLLAYRFW